jgi:hypothetical protein
MFTFIREGKQDLYFYFILFYFVLWQIFAKALCPLAK